MIMNACQVYDCSFTEKKNEINKQTSDLNKVKTMCLLFLKLFNFEVFTHMIFRKNPCIQIKNYLKCLN